MNSYNEDNYYDDNVEPELQKLYLDFLNEKN